ncbi:hypothetical protein KM043_007847 [Ampulex compressa]|nr:hypothetical protein KM043_007847 [Ampulex compressa]
MNNVFFEVGAKNCTKPPIYGAIVMQYVKMKNGLPGWGRGRKKKGELPSSLRTLLNDLIVKHRWWGMLRADGPRYGLRNTLEDVSCNLSSVFILAGRSPLVEHRA